jgi:hypothetical protein
MLVSEEPKGIALERDVERELGGVVAGLASCPGVARRSKVL